MRYLSIDYGDKKIGMAFCDKLEIAVKPLPPIINKGPADAIEKINRIIDNNKIEGIVMGAPLGKNNSETQQSIKSRHFADQIKNILNIPIEFWNESYSTQQAVKLMIETGKTKKARQKFIDSYSALLILKEFIDYKKEQERK